MTDLLARVQRRTFRPGRDNALLLVDDSLLSATTWGTRLACAVLLQLFARAPGYGIATSVGVTLTVYRSDGSKRFQVLIGTPIRTVVSLGSFLYVDRRYSVDLRTGKVFGPTKRRVTGVVSMFAALLASLKRLTLSFLTSDEDIVCVDLLFGRVSEPDDSRSEDSPSASNLDNAT